MAKLRHIALIVPDPEKAAQFFEQAFDMKRAGTARRGIYMSDGTINVALLRQEGQEKVGIYHFGMWVDDLDEAEKKVVGAGGKYLAGRPDPAAPGLIVRPWIVEPLKVRLRSPLRTMLSAYVPGPTATVSPLTERFRPAAMPDWIEYFSRGVK